MSDYAITVFSRDEDDGYIAEIAELDSCSAFGETPEEAVIEVGRAKEAWLAAARTAGKAIPRPRPAITR